MKYTKTVTVKALEGDYRWVRNYRTPSNAYEMCVCRGVSVEFSTGGINDPRPTYTFRTLRATKKSSYGINLYVGDNAISEVMPTKDEVRAAIIEKERSK